MIENLKETSLFVKTQERKTQRRLECDYKWKEAVTSAITLKPSLENGFEMQCTSEEQRSMLSVQSVAAAGAIRPSRGRQQRTEAASVVYAKPIYNTHTHAYHWQKVINVDCMDLVIYLFM